MQATVSLPATLRMPYDAISVNLQMETIDLLWKGNVMATYRVPGVVDEGGVVLGGLDGIMTLQTAPPMPTAPIAETLPPPPQDIVPPEQKEGESEIEGESEGEAPTPPEE